VTGVHIDEFDFHLPPELIAQDPPPERGASRLLVLSRETGDLEHARFAELGRYLRPGDLLVVNDTRVFPARLLGRRVPSGGAVECLLLGLQEAGGPAPDSAGEGDHEASFQALMHPGQKLKPGALVVFERDGAVLHGEVTARHFHGRRTIRLRADAGGRVDDAIDRIGHIPLPPYIRRDDRPSDRDRYQTVYARERGSVAAPTAGLHFSASLLAALASQGIERTHVTLHVGYGTFKPMRAARIEDHVVDAEGFSVTPPAADALTRARRDGRRIIAVGTTTARALESLPADEDGRVHAASGSTTLFIRPGHPFRLVDGLITNFHLPRSSLLLLVAALGGRERVLAAYRQAVERGYRFYSYGDAMGIL
jgi:S-adenosylmethionine:tRNA ribosyltransferase-isomerase